MPQIEGALTNKFWVIIDRESRTRENGAISLEDKCEQNNDL
jgi:hypothetical protein